MARAALMTCLSLPYPSFRFFSPVDWIALDDCETALNFFTSVDDSSSGFAATAKARALAFINSVDDGRILL